MNSSRVLSSTLTVGAALGLLAGCASPSSAGGSDGDKKVAVLLASTENSYNQAILKGVQNAADSAGVTLEVFNGQFDANTQLSQLENLQAGKFDGVVVLPNDGVSLAAAFPLASELPVVTVTNPIGPDILSMEPQTDGVVSTVGLSWNDVATTQAEDVVRYCADIDPCKVAIAVGFLSAPLDAASVDAYESVLNEHANIQVVSTVEGEYDRDKSLTAATNILQSNPDLNVLLSNVDQQTSGVVIALEDAGIDPSSVYLTGTGGTQDAVEGVRGGVWKSTFSAFPVQRGEAALEQLLHHLNGEGVEEWVDASKLGTVPAWITPDVLTENPDFKSDWNG